LRWFLSSSFALLGPSKTPDSAGVRGQVEVSAKVGVVG
jgi:hypothetical protein